MKQNIKTRACEIYKILDSLRKNPYHLSYHGEKIIETIRKSIDGNKQLKFVLPSFHGKTPNRSLVPTNLPDYGEFLGIATLIHAYDKIKEFYSNVEICLLHEGHFQGDVHLLGTDNDVDAYLSSFRRMITPYKFIKSYGINELIQGLNSYEEKRTMFLDTYCPTEEQISILIEEQDNLKKLYTSYKKLYEKKHYETIKKQLTTQKSKNEYLRNRGLLQLRKYIGFGKLIKDFFKEDSYIKLSLLYKDNSLSDQIGINIIEGNHEFGTPAFNAVVQERNGIFHFIHAIKANYFLSNIDGLLLYKAV